MIEDALSVLRAEVQIDPTGRPNLVPNPSGDGGSWFWVTPLRFTKITSVGGALRISTAAGVGDAYTQTNPIRLAAGDWISARFDTVGGTAGHKVKARFRFFDLAGNLIATSTPTAGFDTTPGTHYRTAVQAPAGTSYAKLKVDLYNGASPPAVGAHYDFNNVMVTTDAATFGIPYAFTDPVEYTNILGPTNNITITRGAMQPGVIGVRVLDTSLDPADADALRTGRLFRVTALNDDTATFEDLEGGLYILRAEVSYDLKKPPDKQAAISLTLTDSLQILANVVRQISVGTIDELPFVLETAGVPFNINGQTGTLIDDPVVTARIDQATALDQVLLTRDSNQGYAWVSKSGVVNVWTDRGTDFYGGPVTFDESSYSNIDIGFDTDNCINEVLIVLVIIDPGNGETVEKTYGPYRDEAAVDKWKVVKQATFRITGLAEADVPAFAADVLANRAEPVRRVNSLTIPIRTPEDITTAKALLDLYATANIINTAKGIDLDQHVTSISHSIQCTAKGVRWVMTLGFDVAEAVSSPAPVGGASGAAVVPAKRPGFWNTDYATATGPGDVPVALTYKPIDGSMHLYVNGLAAAPDEWTIDGQTITLHDPDSLLLDGDKVHAAYAIATSFTTPSEVALVGENSYQGTPAGDTNLALPAGTVAGDLLILVNCSWTPRTISDSRFGAAAATLPGQFVGLGHVWVGTADASGDPITMHGASLHDVSALIALRGASLIDVQTSHDNTVPIATPANNPTVADVRTAVCVALRRSAGTAGGITHTAGDFTPITGGNDSNEVAAEISLWSDDAGAAVSPSDSFAFPGTVDAWGLVTLKVG